MNKQNEMAYFDLFNFDISIRELLGRAIKTEIEEAEIYRDLLEKDLLEETRSKVERFITQEEDHKEKLEATFDDFFPGEEIPLPDRSGIEIPKEISQQVAPKELMEKAMDAESDAEEFYREMIHEFEEKEVRRLLGFLASNEREHYEILKEELGKLE